jgi:hypothetical protein
MVSALQNFFSFEKNRFSEIKNIFSVTQTIFMASETTVAIASHGLVAKVKVLFEKAMEDMKWQDTLTRSHFMAHCLRYRIEVSRDIVYLNLDLDRCRRISAMRTKRNNHMRHLLGFALLFPIVVFAKELPLPEILLNAKTALVVNDSAAKGDFKKFCNKLKKWGRFTLVQDRDSADIIISLSNGTNRKDAWNGWRDPRLMVRSISWKTNIIYIHGRYGTELYSDQTGEDGKDTRNARFTSQAQNEPQIASPTFHIESPEIRPIDCQPTA